MRARPMLNRATLYSALMTVAMIGVATASARAQWKMPSSHGVVLTPSAEPMPAPPLREEGRRTITRGERRDTLGEEVTPRRTEHGQTLSEHGLTAGGGAAYGSSGAPCGSASWLGAATGAANGAMFGLVLTSLFPLPAARRNQLFFGLIAGGAVNGALKTLQTCAMSARSPYSLPVTSASSPATAPAHTVVRGSAFRLDEGSTP